MNENRLTPRHNIVRFQNSLNKKKIQVGPKENNSTTTGIENRTDSRLAITTLSARRTQKAFELLREICLNLKCSLPNFQ